MKFPYDFGISQDDPQVEDHALNLENSTLLCIASGGEVPLSILATHNIQIKAVDVSLNQIRLCNLKLAAARTLEPDEAAIFLGFKTDTHEKRAHYLSKVSSILSATEIDFWKNQDISDGPIWHSRFERYITIFCKLIRHAMGEKRLRQFFDLESLKEQEEYFDKYLHKRINFWFFKIAFSPKLYKKRGLDKQALIHQKGIDMATTFYNKFKKYFTATPASNNYYLQLYFLNEVLFDQALPAYLQPEGVQNIRSRHESLKLEAKSIFEEISSSESLRYENYALSNISDWCDEESMNKLLLNISEKSSPTSNLLIRYIHKNPVNDSLINKELNFNEEYQKETYCIDRFPFYSLIKAKIGQKVNL